VTATLQSEESGVVGLQVEDQLLPNVKPQWAVETGCVFAVMTEKRYMEVCKGVF
jgi:hypothetical protein